LPMSKKIAWLFSLNADNIEMSPSAGSFSGE
jgi:hypothetical protein